MIKETGIKRLFHPSAPTPYKAIKANINRFCLSRLPTSIHRLKLSLFTCGGARAPIILMKVK
jgi:hypothetical protein